MKTNMKMLTKKFLSFVSIVTASVKTKLYFFLVTIICISLATCKKEIEPDNNSGTTGKGRPKTMQCEDNGLPPKIVNIINDFNADPNDNLDDSEPFLQAANYINQYWQQYQITLLIPGGTNSYRVGRQVLPASTLTVPSITVQGDNVFSTSITNTGGGALPVSILRLQCAERVIIHGVNNGEGYPNILFNDNLYHGQFDNQIPPEPLSGGDNWVIGNFIELKHCSCIDVDHLFVQGNNQYFVDNAHIGAGLLQLAHDGIMMEGSINISVTNSEFSNFCRDGIATYNDLAQPPCGSCRDCENIHLENIASKYNGRWGFGNASGVNLTAIDCRFWYTGTILYVSYGSGMDIEPEYHCRHGYSTNQYFYRCEFACNYGWGMISDNHDPWVRDITFEECMFVGTNKEAVFPNQMIRTKFINCNIWGGILQVAGTGPTDLLEFTGCTFTDEDFQLPLGPSLPVYPPGGVLMNLGAPTADFDAQEPTNYYFHFRENTINIHNARAILTSSLGPNRVNDKLRIFTDNDFNFFYNDIGNANYVSQPQPLAVFLDCQLYHNRFTDMNPATSVPTPPLADVYSIVAQVGTEPPGCPYPLNFTDGLNEIVPHVAGSWSHIPRNYCPACCYFMTWTNF